VAESSATGGGSGLKRKCLYCKRIGEALATAGRADSRVRVSFNKKTLVEQRDYMRGQKRKRESADKNARYHFDDLVVEEETYHDVANEARLRVLWEPYGQFEDRMLMTRRCNTPAECQIEWRRVTTEDLNTVCKEFAGMLCIKRFVGGIEDVVDRTGTKLSAKRRKIVEDQSTLTDVMKAGEDRLSIVRSDITPHTMSGINDEIPEDAKVVCVCGCVCVRVQLLAGVTFKACAFL
jgi:hypothetical protein